MALWALSTRQTACCQHLWHVVMWRMTMNHYHCSSSNNNFYYCGAKKINNKIVGRQTDGRTDPCCGRWGGGTNILVHFFILWSRCHDLLCILVNGMERTHGMKRSSDNLWIPGLNRWMDGWLVRWMVRLLPTSSLLLLSLAFIDCCRLSINKRRFYVDHLWLPQCGLCCTAPTAPPAMVHSFSVCYTSMPLCRRGHKELNDRVYLPFMVCKWTF